MVNLNPKKENLIGFQKGHNTSWNSLPTTTIRVPRAIKDEVLEYAHMIDQDSCNSAIEQENFYKKLDELISKIRANEKGYKTCSKLILLQLKQLRGLKNAR